MRVKIKNIQWISENECQFQIIIPNDMSYINKYILTNEILKRYDIIFNPNGYNNIIEVKNYRSKND